jgi:hypothetical protein
LVAHTRILQWTYPDILWAIRCNCWRIVYVTHIGKAKILLEKITKNQSWKPDNNQRC